jgi:hypothetical protein
MKYADILVSADGPEYRIPFELGITLEKSVFYNKWLPEIKDVFVEEVVDRLYRRLRSSSELYSSDLFERIALGVLDLILDSVLDDIRFSGERPDCIVLPGKPSSSYRGPFVIRNSEDFWELLVRVYGRHNLLEEIEAVLNDKYGLEIEASP